MNKSQRITIDPTNRNADNYVFVNLNQDVKTLEFLSMSLRTEDIYARPNADYGILVGRVIGNDGVGIPNAKISVFLPLTNEDEENGEIKSVYPYKKPTDINNEGKRYNLLNRVATLNKDGSYSPKQPFGSFPIKPEIITNKIINEVYNKYYKYSTVTNDSGDYMIFGLPVGTHTIHMSVDITDIGKYSMNPASMVINLGYSPHLFTNDNTVIKPSSDITDLPHIETQEITVDVIPFWGDRDNFEIGITRQNFRIRAALVNTFTVFGTSMTDGYDVTWGGNEDTDSGLQRLYRHNNTINNVTPDLLRTGIVKEMIFYYPPEVSDSEINSNNDDLIDKFRLLDKDLYTSHKRDGDFVFIISCNRRKVITGEDGGEIEVPHTHPSGVFTEFKGSMTLEYDEEDIEIGDNIKIGTRNYSPIRYRFKFPQYNNGTLGNPTFPLGIPWKKQIYEFQANKIYSISKFIPTTHNKEKTSDWDSTTRTMEDDTTNSLNFTSTNHSIVGCLIAESQYTTEPNDRFPHNKSYNNFYYFGANWLNFCVYFPQIKYSWGEHSDIHSSTNFNLTLSKTHLEDNNSPILANQTNTKWFAREDIHWTDFIEVPISDIVDIYRKVSKKGFNSYDLSYDFQININKNNYRYGDGTPSWGGVSCPYNGGKVAGNPSLSKDTEVYFYKGRGGADCIEYLVELGIVVT